MSPSPDSHLAAAHAVFEKDRTFTTSDGTNIAYSVVNADDRGTAVVFMNGWTCPDAYWKNIVPGIVDAGHPQSCSMLVGTGSRVSRDLPVCSARSCTRKTSPSNASPVTSSS